MTETAELMAQLDRHVQALDSAGVAAWCREVGPKQLRSMRTTIAAFAEKQYRHYDRNESWLDAKRRAGAAALAVLASASTVNKAAAGIDYSAVSIDLTAAVDLMAELRPSWLDGLAERLLKNRSATHWNLGHALQAAGLTTKPSGREYLVQMASSLFPVARKLREHPELIDDMWRLLTTLRSASAARGSVGRQCSTSKSGSENRGRRSLAGSRRCLSCQRRAQSAATD